MKGLPKMEIYDQYYLRAESGFNEGAFLLAAILLGNPLTGEWIFAQLVEDELLLNLIGDANTEKVNRFLSEVKSNINSRSENDSSVPTGHLFGSPWLLALAQKYENTLNLEEAVHIHAQGTGQALIHAYAHMQEEMSKLSAHHSHHDHSGKGKGKGKGKNKH